MMNPRFFSSDDVKEDRNSNIPIRIEQKFDDTSALFCTSVQINKEQQGTVQRKRRRGRQKKSWTDNILEWTGKSFAVTQATVHSHTRWSQLVHRSSIMQCPHDPGGSRDQ
ncbi:hypothetical protein RRG08_017911 [Elysia crispata]|uniref:Uncharacterized protein n=1 Tax=Elysia crispata TaxID=231223 RepID=A0AAE1DVK4_9GAST|nr:hypothetical protein RRG08_017911 [Elysia crispata]